MGHWEAAVSENLWSSAPGSYNVAWFVGHPLFRPPWDCKFPPNIASLYSALTPVLNLHMEAEYMAGAWGSGEDFMDPNDDTDDLVVNPHFLQDCFPWSLPGPS